MSTLFVVNATRSGKFFEAPTGFVLKWVAGIFAASAAMVYSNRVLFNVPPESTKPEWIAEALKHGPVATREGAPPVFLNPITLRLPGNIRGPEDVPE